MSRADGTAGGKGLVAKRKVHRLHREVCVACGPLVINQPNYSFIFNDRNTLLNALSKLRSFCGATATMYNT